MKTDKTAEIYIHVPFCKRKCDYCDFVSFVTDRDTQNRYFDMLVKEIEIKAESMGKLPIDSVFFGGGTPSLTDESNISRVMDALTQHFSFSKSPEITIEMNPHSATEVKISEYKKTGVNRVSIGLQSAENTELKALSRIHSFEQFLDTYDNVRKAGFTNVNIDLMSAIPGQTVESYRRTLEKISELAPEHISAYSLIIEEGTPFYDRYKDGKGLPDEDVDREMYHLTKEFLSEKGYSRYEISNYAKPGYECRHNIGYWKRVPYIGFGIAAASLYGDVRYTKHSNLNAYINGDFSEEEIILTDSDMMEEYMFLGLRMVKGVSISEFHKLFGKSIYEEYGDQITKLMNEELLEIDGDRLFLNDRGLDISNYCMAEFLH